MIAPEETAHTTVVQRQWALKKTASKRRHFKVVEGQVEAYAIQAPPVVLRPGTIMADGSVFAGLTDDSKQQIYAMPADPDMTMTFNDAAKYVTELNGGKAFGHDDWQIPSLENLRVLQKNQNEGALKGTFNTFNKGSGSGYPGWYWSRTPGRDYPTYVASVRFSDGDEGWDPKDDGRLSCRPVRLVAASAAPSLG